MAFIAFRMTFASILDFRFNHIRLPRTTSLFLRRKAHESSSAAANVSPVFRYSPGGEIGELKGDELPFSREGGWGWGVGEGAGGAPFDATAMGGSMGGGGGHGFGRGGMGGGGGGLTGNGAGGEYTTNGVSGHNNGGLLGQRTGHGLNGNGRTAV